MEYNIENKSAFTLAEVLITLGIIGVVAAMTIPILVANYQKEQTTTQLKKAYTQIYQAIKLSEIDNGPVSTWNLGTSKDYNALLIWFNEYMKPYMKYTKAEDSLNAGSPGSMDVYLADGSKIRFWNAEGVKLHVSIYLKSIAKPRYGKDHFLFFLKGTPIPGNMNAELRPYDYPLTQVTSREDWKTNATYGCNKTSVNKAQCAGLIIFDGWKISDDYPW